MLENSRVLTLEHIWCENFTRPALSMRYKGIQEGTFKLCHAQFGIGNLMILICLSKWDVKDGTESLKNLSVVFRQFANYKPDHWSTKTKILAVYWHDPKAQIEFGNNQLY